MKKMLCLFSIVFIMIGCSTPKTVLDEASAGNEKVPASFNPAQGTLLIEGTMGGGKNAVVKLPGSEVAERSYSNFFITKKEKSMTEYANKNYGNKFEFVKPTDIYSSDGKYGDKNAYRWALVTSLREPIQSVSVHANGTTAHHSPTFKYYLFDRLNNITYSALGQGSPMVLKAFKQAIGKIKGE
jgi:hypothetical protein